MANSSQSYPGTNFQDQSFYLHKTFCLACRTNFGQRRELQAHLQATHQATMDKTFASIRTHEPIDEPAPINTPGLPIENMEQIPFHRQPEAFSALFKHERDRYTVYPGSPAAQDNLSVIFCGLPI